VVDINKEKEGIPIGELFPYAEIEEITDQEAALVQLRESYKVDLQTATQNKEIVQNELNRLQSVIYQLEGCVMAIDAALPLVQKKGCVVSKEEPTEKDKPLRVVPNENIQPPEFDSVSEEKKEEA